MPARKVDIAFCLDTSDSMKPCIDAVRKNIGQMIDQLKQANFEWRLGFVAHHIAGRNDRGGYVYTQQSISGGTLDILYHNGQSTNESGFFTSNIEVFKGALADLECAGDEDMLLALDTTLDAPFGLKNETQRVVVLISDEPFETNEPERLKYSKEKLEDIKQKIMDRGITLLAVMPIRENGIAEDLSMVDKADFTDVEENDAGMTKVDMSSLFSHLGKTISVSTMQSNGEETYKRALFNQDKWGSSSSFKSIGDTK